MKELFIASNNKNKIAEIKEILTMHHIDCNILCPSDFSDSSEPLEDGLSYEENAFIKASYYFNKYHFPTLADDSGINIDYFGSFPNIHSARFLHIKDYNQKNHMIIDLMKDIKHRDATFVAVVCYIDENGNKHLFKGENKGEISKQMKGDKGFGYDPIFLIPELEKTEAELGESYKNMYSHRAKALNQWINYVSKEES